MVTEPFLRLIGILGTAGMICRLSPKQKSTLRISELPKKLRDVDPQLSEDHLEDALFSAVARLGKELLLMSNLFGVKFQKH